MQKIGPESSIRRNPELLSVEMDGDLVMMSIESGNYFGVSGIGPHIWQLMETPRSLAELVESVCSEFEVDSATASADLLGFLGELSQNGMIEVS